jgi:plasmid stability protein
MAQVLIRNLDPQVVETYRRRAAEKGHSLEAELRAVLTEGAKLTRAERAERVREMLEYNEQFRNPDVPMTPGWMLIREDRDSDER